MKLFHGSSSVVSEVKNIGVFGGVFAHCNESVALSHGDNLHIINVDEDRVLTQHALNYELDYDVVCAALRDVAVVEDDDFDMMHEIVIEEAALADFDEDEVLRVFHADDLAEAGWDAQRLRGKVAAKLGYLAVEMDDEHGTSYLILSGAEISCQNH